MEVRSRRFTRFTFSFSALSVSAFSRLAPKLLNASTVQPLLSAFQLSVFSVCFPISPLSTPQPLNLFVSLSAFHLLISAFSSQRFSFFPTRSSTSQRLNLLFPLSPFSFSAFAVSHGPIHRCCGGAICS